jgi:hypothetical protein
MNIYLLTQNVAEGYDTYDSMAVIGEDEHGAKMESIRYADPSECNYCWAKYPDQIACELIGTANSNEAKVVLASFNAG